MTKTLVTLALGLGLPFLVCLGGCYDKNRYGTYNDPNKADSNSSKKTTEPRDPNSENTAITGISNYLRDMGNFGIKIFNVYGITED